MINAAKDKSTLGTGSLLVLMVVAALFGMLAGKGFSTKAKNDFTSDELALLRSGDEVMYVLDVANPADSAVLRIPSVDLSRRALRSSSYKELSKRLLATVRDPSQDGVGIAAPQVGISKRVIAVCRVDKDGEPFEVYPNVRIDSLFGEKLPGWEGCLSVPGYRGIVSRYTDVMVSWTDPETLKPMRDTVHGYAAIIFQHECDHLDGILYTDRADSVCVSTR